MPLLACFEKLSCHSVPAWLMFSHILGLSPRWKAHRGSCLQPMAWLFTVLSLKA